MRVKRRIGVLFVFVMLAGCHVASVEESLPTEETEVSYSVSDFSEREVQFDEIPDRIAVLGNGELDIVYALGAEVVGRPKSMEPPTVVDAENAIQVGTSHEIDLERLTFAAPDLVFANRPMNEKDIPMIEGAGAEVLLTSANSIEEVKEQIRLIGSSLQKQEEATALIEPIEQKILDLQENLLHKKPSVLLVYGAPGSNLAALPNSLAGNLLEVAGGENIAASYEQLNDFPQYAALSSERVIEANPDIVLFMAHGDPAAVQESFIQEMEQHSGWSQLPAVKEGRLEVLPPDLFGTNPGTRIIEALDYMRGVLEGAEQASERASH